MKDLFLVKCNVRMKDRKGKIMQVFSDVRSMDACISVRNARKEKTTFSAVVRPICKLLSVKKKKAKYNYLITKC